MGAGFINYTPHPVHIQTVDGATIILQPVLPTPRVGVHFVETGLFVRVRITIPTYGPIEDLPDPVSGKLLIVSRMVAERAAWRADLVFPDDVIRDAEGKITGCKALGSVSGVSEQLEEFLREEFLLKREEE